MLIFIIQILLSIAGLTISLYFALVYYGRMRADPFFIPQFCRLEEKSCKTILGTPQARLFRVPNFVPGMLYYFIVLVVGILGVLGTPLNNTFFWGLIGASCLTVFVGIYLSYSLLAIIRIPCPLCFTGHGINIILCGMFLYQKFSV